MNAAEATEASDVNSAASLSSSRPVSINSVVAVQTLFVKHCSPDESEQTLTIQELSDVLRTALIDFDGFCRLIDDLNLSSAWEGEAALRAAFDEARAQEEAMTFEAFSRWADSSGQTEAILEEMAWRDEPASIVGGIVRALSRMTRPLIGLVTRATGMIQYIGVFMMKKISNALKASMRNPTKFFRRNALSPWEILTKNPAGLVPAIRAEWIAGGVAGFSLKMGAPYIANTVVAMSMFQAYTSVNGLMQHQAPDGAAKLFACEIVSGAAAGLVQASLNTPLYNIKNTPGKTRAVTKRDGLVAGLRYLGRTQGLACLFRTYPYIVAQECVSLSAFFTSYEYFKLHSVHLVRQYDSSEDKDAIAWTLSATGAGVVLAAIGTPYENVLAWHVKNRKRHSPSSVVKHFVSLASRAEQKRILFSGMRKRLYMAPIAGLPLLAYEAMYRSGLSPALHNYDEA